MWASKARLAQAQGGIIPKCDEMCGGGVKSGRAEERPQKPHIGWVTTKNVIANGRASPIGQSKGHGLTSIHFDTTTIP